MEKKDSRWNEQHYNRFLSFVKEGIEVEYPEKVYRDRLKTWIQKDKTFQALLAEYKEERERRQPITEAYKKEVQEWESERFTQAIKWAQEKEIEIPWKRKRNRKGKRKKMAPNQIIDHLKSKGFQFDKPKPIPPPTFQRFSTPVKHSLD